MSEQVTSYKYEDMDYVDESAGIYGREIEADIYYTLNDEVAADTPFGPDVKTVVKVTTIECWCTYYDRDGGELRTEDFELTNLIPSEEITRYVEDGL